MKPPRTCPLGSILKKQRPRINTSNRFERVDCLVELGEWMIGRDSHQAGVDYLRSALDVLYDVEEQVVLPVVTNKYQRRQGSDSLSER